MGVARVDGSPTVRICTTHADRQSARCGVVIAIHGFSAGTMMMQTCLIRLHPLSLFFGFCGSRIAVALQPL